MESRETGNAIAEFRLRFLEEVRNRKTKGHIEDAQALLDIYCAYEGIPVDLSLEAHARDEVTANQEDLERTSLGDTLRQRIKEGSADAPMLPPDEFSEAMKNRVEGLKTEISNVVSIAVAGNIHALFDPFTELRLLAQSIPDIRWHICDSINSALAGKLGDRIEAMLKARIPELVREEEGTEACKQL